MARSRSALKRVRRRRFGVILADPAWTYRDKCQAGERGIEWVHGCMSDQEILDLREPVQRVADSDCVLMLWAVWPKLPLALEVIAAWGFSYKTIGLNWVKVTSSSTTDDPRAQWGMGNWTRSGSEPCLLAVRGNPKRRSASVHSTIWAPDPALEELIARGGWDHVLEAQRGYDKSAKPHESRRRIRALTHGPRLEMFSRGPAPTGWWGWGLEAEGPRLVTL